MSHPVTALSNGSSAVHRLHIHEHSVQFYESDEYLIKRVAEYLARGFRHGNAMVVIATPEHREGFRQVLESEGFDVNAALRNGQLEELDACNTLLSFMEGD